MVQYRRNRATGGTFFLTVALANRRSRILIEQIAALRMAVAETRKQYPFAIEAIVVLPDHLHVMMTLPQDDADFSNRLSLIKRRFTTAVLKSGRAVQRRPNGEIALWQRRFWEHTIRDEKDFNGTSIIFISIPSNTSWSRECVIGLTRRFTAMCGSACCRGTGRGMSEIVE
jgi:putative transposase